MDELQKQPVNLRRFGALFSALLALVLATAGAYFLASKFLRDRDRALGLYRPPTTSRGTTPKTTPYVPPSGMDPNQAAVQQSLRTLEEINRINEMNRRLQEQQERSQRQR